LDPKARPRAIDLIVLEGKEMKTLLGIYELDGDTLKICLSEQSKVRPTEFKPDKDTKTGVVILKREKK
jgi:uncharacterized protein (TIGR03067 family)